MANEHDTESPVPSVDKRNNAVIHSTGLFSLAAFHLRTLWLFTFSEHQTIVYPWTALGLFGALSGGALTTNLCPNFWVIVSRLPSVLLWMWWHILVFTVASQRLPGSVVEDSTKRPWRPLPSGRIPGVQARRLLLGLVPATFILTHFFGAAEYSLLSLLLTWLYNDLEGANENFIIRNLINSLGLVCWSAGTIVVACGKGQHQLNCTGYFWLKVEAAILFTTLPIQDLRDQEGDRARGRSTTPVVLGDTAARFTIGVSVVVWSYVCPSIWGLSFYGRIVPAVLGTAIQLRIMKYKTVEADELTLRMWRVWIGILFLLPLCHNPTVLKQLI
ncbi:hypothetical protein MMC07_000646 [Pseudocyphellaria aurata]|nr:hypothetical protein [Pseudocyphellaria aurata]